MIFTSFDSFLKGINGFDSLIELRGILTSLVIEAVTSVMLGSGNKFNIIAWAVFEYISVRNIICEYHELRFVFLNTIFEYTYSSTL